MKRIIALLLTLILAFSLASCLNERSSGGKRESTKKDEVVVDTEEKYKKEVISNFFKYGRLIQIPTQRKKREIVLLEILKQFEIDREYDEKEVNEIIIRYHEDFCTIRREMIAFGMMTRHHETYIRVK